MSQQLPDGTTVNDDGSPLNNGDDLAAAVARRTPANPNEPMPKAGSYSLGSFPSDQSTKLLQDPYIRGAMNYAISRGERPVLSQVAASQGHIPDGMKAYGSEGLEDDHSLRNGGLLLAAIMGGGYGLNALGGGAGAAGSAAQAASTVPEFGITAGAPITEAMVPTVTGAVNSAAAAAATGAAAGAGAGSTMSSYLDEFPDALEGNLTSESQFPTGSYWDLVGQNSPKMIPNDLTIKMGPNYKGAGSKLMNLLQRDQNNPFADLSSGLGSLAQGQANNRSMFGNFAQQYDRNMLQAQQDAIAARNDAMKNVQRSSYISGRDSGYKAPTLNLASGNTVALPDFGFGFKASTPDEKAAATLMRDQAMKTLGPGGTYTPQPLDTYAKAGGLENVANAGASVLGLMPSMAKIGSAVPWDKVGGFFKGLV